MKHRLHLAFTALVLLALQTLIAPLSTAQAQGTAFTYQGRLNNGTNPANGFYDFVFALSNAPSGGSQVGSSLTNPAVGVTNGLFAVTLNFGAVFGGNSTWLSISVRSNGVGTFATLNPPQELNPTPYAIFANTAGNYSGTVSVGNLTGTLSDAQLPSDLAFLDAASQTFTGTNLFDSPGHSFILNTGSTVATNIFTGLSLQYQPSQGESIFQSSYNDGYSSISFWTKQGGGFPVARQVFIDRYGNFNIDFQNANNATFNSGSSNGAALVFGNSSSGEGMASQRQAGGGNQFGLDFYTDYINRMSVTHGGFVGIGTTNPATALQVNGTVTATAFSGGLAASNITGTILATNLPANVVVENENGVTLDNLMIGGNLDLPFPATIDTSGLSLLRADANDNFFAGLAAGNLSVTGACNTGVGDDAFMELSTGSFNTAQGFQALFDNSVGSFNTASGAFALLYNTTGSNNTATGAYALSAYNVPLFVVGGGNTADGASALAGNEGGYNNTGVGFQAMQNNTNGYDNVAIGVNSLVQLNSGTANFDNTAIGAYSCQNMSIGYWNTAVGEDSFATLTNGTLNLAIGLEAGYYLASGTGNMYIGSYGNSSAPIENNVTRIGAGQSETFISSWNGAFLDGVLSMDQGDTNNGIVEIANTANYPGLNFGGIGTFIYGFDGGALGTVDPTEVSLAWNFQGNVWCSNNFSTLSLTVRGGSDLAEPFKITPDKNEVPDGSVVVIDDVNPGRLKVSSQPYDTRVAGILSGANGVHAGIQMHQEGLLEGDRNVALTGRVYVQADISNGAIKPGDLLTTSSAPGRAMKVTDHARAQGAILGKAMSSLSEGDGMVLVLVTLQ